jgi:hypothetical protein
VDVSGTRSEVDHEVASDDFDRPYSAPEHGVDDLMREYPFYDGGVNRSHNES